MSATQSHMEKRVEETHKAEWHNYAGAGSLISLILPVLSEFEGIGEDLAMGVGGAGAASVFVILIPLTTNPFFTLSSKILKFESTKTSVQFLINKGFRKSGLSVPYFSKDSKYGILGKGYLPT